MKTLVVLGALGAAALGLAACEDYYPAAPPPPPGAVAVAPAYGVPAVAVAPACFRTYDIKNHTVADDHTLYINVYNRAVYRIDLSGACLAGATSSDPIIMREPPGSTYVCHPIDLDVGVRVGGGVVNHCIVSAITPLTPDQVAALPPKLRP
ncbi:DUF6491 family protein [Phenylobacterium sp.]|uniref:DUF6491 family protein n=1 Tax=Phenylobacterium sp. TaxID=1871053 RepID=UPI00261E76BE|nr:DUF6491 family protein [Phenylobacterium sp.]